MSANENLAAYNERRAYFHECNGDHDRAYQCRRNAELLRKNAVAQAPESRAEVVFQ